MFALQRQQKIMELLYANKGVDVSVLSKLFNVSEVTIRRDFNKLENDGLIVKTYGGAILKEDEPDTDLSEVKISDESGMVKLAVALIDDFDSIFIGTGVCSLDIAKALSGRKLSVITNDVCVAAELSKTPTIRTFIIGSELKPFSSALIGDYNEKMLSSFAIAKSFVSVNGTDLNSGFTLSSIEECRIISSIVPITRKLIILAQSRSFNKPSLAKLIGLNAPQAIVTDADIPSEYKEYFFGHKISVYTPFNFK